MARIDIYSENWQMLPWKKFKRNVYRLQKRIYRAARRGDWKCIHRLQRLLLHSWSARCLAVRQVTQDNRGRRTAGVDGVASLTPQQRLQLVGKLKKLDDWKAQPIRRVYIPKPGKAEKRGLGIPVMADRACQALAKLVLEPEWEAVFEPNSYGFRPGRSTQDAKGAIYFSIFKKPKYALDADIEKCFDRIAHEPLLGKLKAIQVIQQLVRQWLKAGVMDEGKTIYPEAGTPQGGVLSPLLANVALHGLENVITAISKRYRIFVIRYADDLVILCEDLATLLEARRVAEEWLAGVGLQLKESKTRLTHTLNEYEGQVGFDFLGFNVRQYHVGQYHTYVYRGKPGYKTLIKPSQKGIKRHTEAIRVIIRQHEGLPQAALIARLNPVIRGWTNYYRSSVAKSTFSKVDRQMWYNLGQWAKKRHSNKTIGWRYRRYWKQGKTRMDFSDGKHALIYHRGTPITRHVKVRGDKSPYDGDWVYWSQRMGQDPTKPKRVTQLLRQQEGRCGNCGGHFGIEDVMEIHHQDGDRKNNRYSNLVLLHAHCHDQSHSKRCQ
jgi:RNA-directed DNA polymerase